MKTKAFTLIETMVAVTILTLAIAGPLMTANSAIVAAEISRDQLSASYLGQEGIEYVRSVRDNAYLADYPSNTSNAWNDFLGGTIGQCRAPNICTLGLMQGDGTLPLCQGSSCAAPFSLVPNGTKFSRTVQVVDASPAGITDVRIVSTVSWSFHGIPYSVIINDHLTPWQ